MADYQIAIKNPSGQLLTFAQDFIKLNYTLKLNAPGVCNLTLPYAYNQFIAADTIIEISRKPIGASVWTLEGQTRFFVRKVARRLTTQAQVIEVYAESALTMLQRRITAYFSGDSHVSISAQYTDNAIKQMVRDNFTAATSTYRNWASTIFAVDADVSLAPLITKDFAWRNVLTVAQDMAQSSAELGTYLFFDVVVNGDALQFKTYPNQRGTDHRASSNQPVIFDPQTGNISEVVQTNDYSNMASVSYAAGTGTGSSRLVKQVYDANLVGYGPYGRIESFQDARNTTDLTGLLDEAKTDLQSKIPLNLFNATIQQTPNSIYGVHYYWGDWVTGKFLSNQYDCMLDAVTIDPGDSQTPEKVDVKLQGTLSFSQVTEQV